MKKEVRKISGKELAWYIVAGVVALLGLTSLIFGIVGHHLSVSLDNNFIKQAEKVIVLDFRTWGVIALAGAMVIALITLLVFAKISDRDIEKTIRRQQRIATSNALNDMEIKPAVETIEVEATPAPIAKPVEEKKEEPTPEAEEK